MEYLDAFHTPLVPRNQDPIERQAIQQINTQFRLQNCALRKRLHHPGWLLHRYKELAQAAEWSVRQLCTWLDLDHHDKTLLIHFPKTSWFHQVRDAAPRCLLACPISNRLMNTLGCIRAPEGLAS